MTTKTAMIIKTFLGSIILLITVLVVRTLTYIHPPSTFSSQYKTVNVNNDVAVNNLSRAIQFQTVSYQEPDKFNEESFDNFIHWLTKAYPEVHQKLELKRLNRHSLLFHWRGKNRTEPAVLLSAHYDVVPVIPGTEQHWSYPPFSGQISEGYIWGRGTIDDKSAAIAMLESVNTLLSKNFIPENDIYIAMTHDEEVGSELGSKAITQWFIEQNIKLAWSLDEGSAILDSIVPGVDKLVAMVNIAEKGYLNLSIVAHAKGGHSSMPPKETAVGILSEAIVKLKNSSLPGGLTDISADIYDSLAPQMSIGYRFLFANVWLFKPLIEHVMSGLPSGNAMLRTTTAPTMLSGSIKSNVLPITASAVVNFRIHPRDNVEEVIAFVKNCINDSRIDVSVMASAMPSNVANQNNVGYSKVVESARHIYRDVIVTPGISIGGTDSRNYSQITDSFRFNPIVMNKQDLVSMHGTNERIKIDNFINAIRFYANLMQQL